MEETAEASQAPGTVGVVALVETDSGAEARNEVSAEHLNINFNNPEKNQKKTGLKYFILHYTRLFLCVCTIGENTSLRYFFCQYYFAHKHGSLHFKKKKCVEKTPKNLQEKKKRIVSFVSHIAL